MRWNHESLERYERNNPVPRSRGRKKCTSGKVVFVGRSSAAHVATDMQKKNKDIFIEPYQCNLCGGWHVGHPMGTKPLISKARESMNRL